MTSELCARCGHESGDCPRCDRHDDVLGGYVAGLGSLCHTHVEPERRPSCFELTTRERDDAVREELTRHVYVPPRAFEQLLLDIDVPDPAPTLAAALSRPRRFVGACPCACNSGGWCGGCGHAGCGGRR